MISMFLSPVIRKMARDHGIPPAEMERMKGTGASLAVTTTTTSATSFFRVIPDATGMLLGANVNESGTALEVPLLEQSRSERMRTFFPIKRFLNGSRTLASDADLDAVRLAVHSGRKLVLCLKLNFDDEAYQVEMEPAPPLVNTILSGVTWTESQILRWVSLPVGTSIICIAQKPKADRKSVV